MLSEIMGMDIGSSIKSTKDSVYYRVEVNKKKYIVQIVLPKYVKDYKVGKYIEKSIDAVGNLWILQKNAKKI